MKRTFILIAIAFFLVGGLAICDEATLIDFTLLSADISVNTTDKDGNKKTVTEKNPKYQEYLEKKQQLEETVANTKKELEQLKQNRIEAEEQKLKLEEELAE